MWDFLKKMTFNKKLYRYFLYLLTIMLFFISIGYSVLQQNLTISGDVKYYLKGYYAIDCDGNKMDTTVPNNLTGLARIMAEQAYLDNGRSEYVTNCEGVKFNALSSNTNGKGVYEIASTKNDTYPIYYYRGQVDNNNVIFANHCWKAVRTTDTGGVKLIYNGEVVDNKCLSTRGTHVGYDGAGSDQTLNNNYYYGTDYNYANGAFSLAGNIEQKIWNSTNGPTLVGKYTCKSTSSTGTCSTLYFIESYKSSTQGYALALSGNSSYGKFGNITFNKTANSLSDSGYMSNERYTIGSQYHLETVLYGNNQFSTNYWYADNIGWDSSTNKYYLVNPYKISSTSEYPNLLGKYTFASSTENYTSNSVKYIVHISGSLYQFINLYDEGNHTLSYFNRTYTYGDSYTDNGNGTATINNATTIHLTDWPDYYANTNNKYICVNASNNTCSDLMYSTASSMLTISALKPIEENYKYGKSFTYNSNTNTYTLTDTVNIWNYTDSTNIDTMTTHHYTCRNSTGTCTTLYYIYYVDSYTLYYFTLTGGKSIIDATNEMLNNSSVNTNNSLIKTGIDQWYKKYLLAYNSYIEDTIYCNDRSTEITALNPNGGAITEQFYLNGYYKPTSTNTPNLTCPRTVDSFSVTSATGNGKLTYPVGLLTLDESMYAGTYQNYTQTSYYLYNGSNFWTISPAGIINGYVYEVTTGYFQGSSHTASSSALRPVISLSPGTNIDEGGEGTEANPYVVDGKPNASYPTGTVTITGATTKIYGASAATLTCSSTTNYMTGVNKYYSFGYSTTDGGMPSNWSTPSTSSTFSVSTNYVGNRYYSCRVYASDGTFTSETTTSFPADDVLVKVNNAKITFNAGTGTLNGSGTLYARKGSSSIYITLQGSTAGTIPTASLTDNTFIGWYTAASGGSKVLNADGTFTGIAVSGYTTATAWNTTANKTLYAQFAPTITITYNYRNTALTTFNTAGEYEDTGYLIDWDKDFTITGSYRPATTAKRYLVIGNYSDGTKTLNIEINTSNQFRIYMGNGAVDNVSSTTIGKFNVEIAYTFNWSAASKTYTFTATETTNTNVSMTGTYSGASGIATKTLRVGKVDYRGDNTVFNATSYARNLVITKKFTYGDNLSNPTPVTRRGYAWNGWYTATSGGTQVTDSTAVPATNTTYYGRWTGNTYYVKFNANSGSGTISNLTMTFGSSKNLTANSFTRTNYEFVNWNLNTGGTSTMYTDGQSVSNLTEESGATVNIYAIWRPTTYSVTFNGNGSTSGSMSNESMNYGTAKALTNNAFSRTSYTFNGWSDGIGTRTNGESVTINSNLLYNTSIPTLNTSTAGYAGNWRKNSTSATLVDITDSPALDTTKAINFPANSSGTTRYVDHNNIPITPGESYTISVWAKGTGTLAIKVGNGNPYYEETFNLTSTWTRYTVTFNAVASNISGTGNALASNKKTNIFFGTTTGSGVVQICGMKMERGSSATSYIDTSKNNTYPLSAIWNPISYTISYVMNAGTNGVYAPTTGTYDENVTISKPSKIFTVNINLNSQGATITNNGLLVSSVFSYQEFDGWTASGLDTSTAFYGTSNTDITSPWSDGSTKIGKDDDLMYFKNLRSTTGTVTLTANWNVVAVRLAKIKKYGYECNYNTSPNGTGTSYPNGGTYIPTSTTTGSTTLYVRCDQIVNMLMVHDSNTSKTFGKSISRSSFESIITENSNIVPSTAIDSWDVSQNQNGSIMAWYVDQNGNSKYELHIGQSGYVYANSNSSNTFSGFSNVKTIDLTYFETLNAAYMSEMFARNTSLTSIDVSNFDTSHVYNMDAMFMATGLTLLDLSNFDTSRVSSIQAMVQGSSSLTYLIMDGWNLRRLTTLGTGGGGFFQGSGVLSLSARNWKLPEDCSDWLGRNWVSSKIISVNVTGWDLSITTNLTGLFASATTLQAIIGLETWDTSNVTGMSQMFFGDKYITSLDLSNFDTSNVTNMTVMFSGMSNLSTLTGLNNWDTSKLTEANQMFNATSKLSTLNLDNWNFRSFSSSNGLNGMLNSSGVKTLSAKYWKLPANASSWLAAMVGTSVESIDVTGWDLSITTDLSRMFEGYNKLNTILGLSTWNTSNITNMNRMFYRTGMYSTAFTLNLGNNFDTSNVTDMSYMFYQTGYSNTNFTLNLGTLFDTSSVLYMYYMFYQTGYSNTNFTLNLGNLFDTSSVTNMAYMFYQTGYNNTNFTLNLGTLFDTSSVLNMSYMFYQTGYNNTTFEIDLTQFDFSNVTTYTSIFYGWRTTNIIRVKDANDQNWIITNSGNSNLTTANVLYPDANTSNNTLNRSKKLNPFVYTIDYVMNGGTNGKNAPTSGIYDEIITISKPTKSFHVNINANSQGASVTLNGSIVTSVNLIQEFEGWTASGLDTSTALYGKDNATVTTPWSNESTKVGNSNDPVYFKNLRSTAGKVTLTANWKEESVTLPDVTKPGYKCNLNTSADGKGIAYSSGEKYYPSTTTGSTTLYVRCS